MMPRRTPELRETRAGGALALAPDNFPRWFLIGAGSLILFSLLSVAVIRLTGNGPDQKASAAQTGRGGEQRPLRFEDRSDGGIAITDARTGELVSVLRGEQGFVRGALRALVRERRMREIGTSEAFQLIARPDGGLTLFDPATGRRVDLESFGPTNAQSFARLMGDRQPEAR